MSIWVSAATSILRIESFVAKSGAEFLGVRCVPKAEDDPPRGFYASWLLLDARSRGDLSDSDLRPVLELLRLVQDDLLAAIEMFDEMFEETEARARRLDLETNTGRFSTFSPWRRLRSWSTQRFCMYFESSLYE